MEIEHPYNFTHTLEDIGQDWVAARHNDKPSEVLMRKHTLDVCERLEAILAELHRSRNSSGGD